MGMLIRAYVIPMKAGFVVDFWWQSPAGKWYEIISWTTDAEGFCQWSVGMGAGPNTFRASIASGQVVDGVTYGEYSSNEVSLYDGQNTDLHLFPPQLDPPPDPEPDPSWEYHSTYRGITIEVWVPDGTPYRAYYDGSWHTVSSLNVLKLGIDAYLDEEPDVPEFIETYRDVDIYWLPDLEVFRAQPAYGWNIITATLQECRNLIDEYWEWIEDPDLDPASIIEQLFTMVMVWVDENLSGWLAPVYNWINTGLSTAQLAWEALVADVNMVITDVSGAVTSLATTVGDRWDEFATLTLPSIWDTITTAAQGVYDAVDQAKLDLIASFNQGLADMTSYVDDTIATLDPTGFLSDPLGYIGAAFTNFLDFWINTTVGSFARGLQIGLAGNPPEPKGPGAAFKQGFNSVINKKELNQT